MDKGAEFKVKNVLQDHRRSAFRVYRDVTYGNTSLWHVIKCELLVTLLGGLGGALGLFLRSKLFPSMFKSAGRKVVFGRNLTLRHTHKITLGAGVIIDDNCVLDAKGETNQGIAIGDGVYVGRNTIIYCKNGDITIEPHVNISSNCQVFSSNRLTLKSDSVIAAYCYFLSGGMYDYKDATPFAQQSGTCTEGELVVGANCWLGAGVCVLDAACIGEHCVIGAGAVVSRPIPPHSVAVGVPARVVKTLAPAP